MKLRHDTLTKEYKYGKRVVGVARVDIHYDPAPVSSTTQTS